MLQHWKGFSSSVEKGEGGEREREGWGGREMERKGEGEREREGDRESGKREKQALGAEHGIEEGKLD